MNDLISIVVPVYNTSLYLNRCLDSIINQSYNNLEVILVDDGSVDNSSLICMEYVKKDARFKYFKQKNGGAASARNFGINASSGKYIGFVDSDDVIHEDMFLTLYNNIIENDADLSICEVTRFSDSPSFTTDNKVEVYSKEEALKILLEDKKICSYSVNKLCKLELIKDIEYPVGKLQEDVGTVYKFITNSSKIVYTCSKLYGYFTRSDSVTNTLNSKFIYDYFEMVEKRYNDLLDLDITDYLKLNKANVILGSFIDLSLNRRLLSDKTFKNYMDNKLIELKKLNKEIKNINTKKHNLLISILLFDKNIFFVLMKYYLRLSR